MRCIAKAYMDEPLERLINGIENNLVYLVNPSMEDALKEHPDLGVGFPPESIFEYEVGLFSKLRRAFERGEVEVLRSLWKAATPLKLKMVAE